MNLSKYKFIITSGCSYDNFATAFINPIADTAVNSFDAHRTFFNKNPTFKPLLAPVSFLEQNTIILSLGVGGFGNHWISESVKYYVDFLLKNNVQSTSIYVLVEFSNPSRLSFELPNKHFKLEIPKTQKKLTVPLTVMSSPEEETIQTAYELSNLGNIGRLKNYSPIGKIGDNYITHMGLVLNRNNNKEVDSNKKFLSDLSATRQYRNEIYMAKGNEVIFNENLNFFISTGSYLKANNIDYNLCSMNSLFHFDFDTGDTSNYDIFHPVNSMSIYYPEPIDGNWKKVCVTKSELNKTRPFISDIFPNLAEQVKKTLKLNWTFFEDGAIEKGGIDEFTMYNYLTKGYASPIRTVLDLALPKPQNHPLPILYPIMFKYFAKDCKFIKVNESYIKAAEKFLDFFHNKTDFNHNLPHESPILIKSMYKDCIKEFTEIRDLKYETKKLH